jgi:hypothetical protein
VSVISPLAGDDENQLDADTRRYRGARYEYASGYLTAEHLSFRVPEAIAAVNSR